MPSIVMVEIVGFVLLLGVGLVLRFFDSLPKKNIALFYQFSLGIFDLIEPKFQDELLHH